MFPFGCQASKLVPLLQQLQRKVDRMSEELDKLRVAAARIETTNDALIALVRSQIQRIDQLLQIVSEMSDDAEENALLKEGITEVRNRLVEQAGENESVLPPPPTPPAPPTS